METIEQPEALKALVLDTLDQNKAIDIVDIDLRGKSTIADYMVIASGGSARQVAALAQRIADEVSKKFPTSKRRIEGLGEADWVLVDLGDVVVHLFRPEVRTFYSLEKMWSASAPSTEHKRMMSKKSEIL